MRSRKPIYFIIIVVMLIGINTAANQFSSPYKLPLGELTGSTGFQVILRSSLDDNFKLNLPEISQNLDLKYVVNLQDYFVELSADAFGVWGASPFVREPSLEATFSIKEALVGFDTKYGTVMIGKYAPLLPVSPNDYRYFGLLFGNPNLPIDVVSLYNQKQKNDYEISVGYLNFARGSDYYGQANVDLFLAARTGIDLSKDNYELAISPSFLVSDVVGSYGFGLPFRFIFSDHIFEGDIAAYKLTETDLLEEGLYPAFIIKYFVPNLQITLEGAYVHPRFLPYTGNMANFGGRLSWETGSAGAKIDWGLERFALGARYAKRQNRDDVFAFSVKYLTMPSPFNPAEFILTNEGNQLRFDIRTGLSFYF